MASNSEKINTAFDELSKILGLSFETINGFDRIEDGTAKVVRNLETINRHLPGMLLYRPKEATVDEVPTVQD